MNQDEKKSPHISADRQQPLYTMSDLQDGIASAVRAALAVTTPTGIDTPVIGAVSPNFPLSTRRNYGLHQWKKNSRLKEFLPTLLNAPTL